MDARIGVFEFSNYWINQTKPNIFGAFFDGERLKIQSYPCRPDLLTFTNANFLELQ